MYRSASWNRFSDEYYSHSSSSQSNKLEKPLRLSSSFDGDELPTHDPVVEMAKREKARVKFAESAVHLIPFVLLLCAVVLWLFSNPEIDMGNRGGGLTIEGEIESEIDGTQTGVLPLLDTISSESSNSKQSHDHDHDPDPTISHKLQTKRRLF